MGEAIRTKVTEQGVLIPRTLLQGIEEVEIRKEDNVIFVTPTAHADPILELGKQRLSEKFINRFSGRKDILLVVNMIKDSATHLIQVLLLHAYPESTC